MACRTPDSDMPTARPIFRYVQPLAAQERDHPVALMRRERVVPTRLLVHS